MRRSTINRLDSSLDLSEGTQFLCHVYTLGFREILGTKLQQGDEHPALFPEMLIEGETPQGGFDQQAGFAFVQGIGMIEPAQRLHFLLQRDPKLFDQGKKKIKPQAAFNPLSGDVRVERRIGHDRPANRTFSGRIPSSHPFLCDPE